MFTAQETVPGRLHLVHGKLMTAFSLDAEEWKDRRSALANTTQRGA